MFFRKGELMKKLMACVMIACIGMFCSLGCTKEAKKDQPEKQGEGTSATDKTPADTTPSDTPPVKSDDKAPE